MYRLSVSNARKPTRTTAVRAEASHAPRAHLHVHFIGVGGTGLGPLATLAKARGWSVSGSDRAHGTEQLQILEELGVQVFGGHSELNIDRAFLPLPSTSTSTSYHCGMCDAFVVASSAVPSDNPEIHAARRRRIPVLKREQWLRIFSGGMTTLAVAGTHGKTTTTALLSFLLWKERQARANGPPLMAIVGSKVSAFGPPGNGSLVWTPPLSTNGPTDGGSPCPFPDLVIEADEYDNAFLGLSPTGAIVLNVDHDHVDCFPTHEAALHSFESFARSVEHGGLLLVCSDDAGARSLLLRLPSPSPHPPAITYGFDPAISDVRVEVTAASITLFNRHNACLGSFQTQLMGRHNALNAAAAVTFAALTHLCRDRTPAPPSASTGVSAWQELLHDPQLPGYVARYGAFVRDFPGVDRRFDLYKTAPLDPEGGGSGPPHVFYYDDYAHHPTEIRAVVDACREAHPGARLLLVFQPHTYSRLAAFRDEFQAALAESHAEVVFVLPVFGAREDGSGNELLVEFVEALKARGVETERVGLDRDGAARVMEALRAQGIGGDRDAVVLVMGAGDSTTFTRLITD